MRPEDVDEAFKGKEHQRSTIKCAIREVLSNNLILTQEIRNYLNRVQLLFEEGSLNQQMFGSQDFAAGY